MFRKYLSCPLPLKVILWSTYRRSSRVYPEIASCTRVHRVGWLERRDHVEFVVVRNNLYEEVLRCPETKSAGCAITDAQNLSKRQQNVSATLKLTKASSQ